MKKMILLALFLSSGLANAEIYKWVDEEGVTHYGSRKPDDANATKMNNNGTGEAKELTGEAKKLADSLSKEILRHKGDAATVNCKKAVFNAKDSIDTMLTVGKKNYKSGYIIESNYKEMKRGLLKLQKRISKSECTNAKGKVKGFYKCMSNDSNHIATCGKKYNYEP